MHKISSNYLFSQQYKSLKGEPKKELEWNSRVISTLHALIVATIGFYVFFTDEKFYKHLDMFHHSNAAVIMTGFSLGYFIVDTFYVLRYYSIMGGMLMLIHHVSVICAQFAVVIYRQFQLMGVTISVTELTTPFINLLWFFTELDMKGSFIFKLNGILIWLFWLVTRIGYSTVTIWLWINQWHKLVTASDFVWIFFTLELANITLLNLVWFKKITMGVIKAFFGKAKIKSG
jgi:hypothetical protein